MVKKHSERFKKACVFYKVVLAREGFVVINDNRVENVRELVKELEIGTASLYDWESKYISNVENQYEKMREEYDMKHTKKGNNGHVDLDVDINDDLTDFVIEKAKELMFTTEKIFDQRYCASLGKLLGIKNYGNLNLATLRLKIGLEFIKMSGLVGTIE